MGPLLALQRAYRRDTSVTCLILRLAGDVVEAHVSFLQARGSLVAGQRSKGAHRFFLEARHANLPAWGGYGDGPHRRAPDTAACTTPRPHAHAQAQLPAWARPVRAAGPVVTRCGACAQPAQARTLCDWVLHLLQLYSAYNLGQARAPPCPSPSSHSGELWLDLLYAGNHDPVRETCWLSCLSGRKRPMGPRRPAGVRAVHAARSTG